MLDKELMKDCVTCLLKNKEFKREVNRSRLCKSVIKNLCDIEKCSNVSLLGAVFATSTSSLCALSSYISQNSELFEKMSDVSEVALTLTGVTLGAKFISKFLTAQTIKERSKHEGKVLSYVRDKYIKELCEEENVCLCSEDVEDVANRYDYDMSDYIYDNKTEFDVENFIDYESESLGK